MAEGNWHFSSKYLCQSLCRGLTVGITFNPYSDQGCGRNSKFSCHHRLMKSDSQSWGLEVGIFEKVLQSILICRQSFGSLPYGRLPLSKHVSQNFRSHHYKYEFEEERVLGVRPFLPFFSP